MWYVTFNKSVDGQHLVEYRNKSAEGQCHVICHMFEKLCRK